jgi:hypothetical protein
MDIYVTDSPNVTTSSIIDPVYLTTDTETILVSPVTPAFSPVNDLIITSPTYSTSTTDLIVTSPVAMIDSDSIVFADPSSPYDSYIPSINLSYTRPSFSVYKNLNADPEVQSRISKYIYYKVLDKYLYDDMSDILNYMVVKNGEVSLIKKLDDHKITTVDNDSDKNKDLKVAFIEKNVLSKKIVKNLLHKFVAETGTNWYDIPKKTFYVKQMIHKALKKIIKSEISK